ncbi:MAG: hypothetical protein ACE5ID_07300 [Acidobacteriota bacterium]
MNEDDKLEEGSGSRQIPAGTAPSGTGMDEDWRKAELEKLMFGDPKTSSSKGKTIGVLLFIAFLAVLGWKVFSPSPSTPPAPVQAASADLPDQAPPIQEAAPPPPPPVPLPDPRPYRNLFEVQSQADGQQYIVYTIQAKDDLEKIGEKLHEVTGAPRMVTYQAVQDAYWRKYFSYDSPDVRITAPEEVAHHVGEIIQIPVPLEEFPSFDLAGEVQSYNQS